MLFIISALILSILIGINEMLGRFGIVEKYVHNFIFFLLFISLVTVGIFSRLIVDRTEDTYIISSGKHRKIEITFNVWGEQLSESNSIIEFDTLETN